MPSAEAEGPRSGAALEIVAFGYFRIVCGARDRTGVLPARFRRLFAHLALRAERVDRRRLALEMWPDADREEALANVRRHLHGLRAAFDALGASGGLDATPDSVALAPALRVTIDAARYVDRLRDLAPDDVGGYAEPVFPGEDDEWLHAARERLRGAQRDALTRLLDNSCARADPAAIDRYASMLLAFDPSHEDAIRRAMTALGSLGESARARRLFAEAVRRLRQEYDVEPSRETRELAAELDAARHAPYATLPLELTPFVGRERELQAVQEASTSARAVTVTGAIGVGKSRLARRAAVDLGDAHADGVRYLDVGAFAHAAAARAALADVLGAPAADDASLAAALRARDVLLVFDNCDELRDNLAVLAARLLRVSQRTALLATSCVALDIEGERIVVLEPLAVPPAFADSTTIASAPAVQFFLDRADAAGARGLRARDSLVAIAEVCRELDGLPRALELAAQRLPALGAANLRALVADRFAVLVSQRVELAAAYARSYDALDARSQRLFRCLGLIHGSWSLARLAAYCALDALTLANALASLVERSLVTNDPAGGGFSTLRSTRDYMRRRLTEAGEREDAERRYVAVVLEPVTARGDELRGARAFAAFDELEREVDDLRAALDIAIAGGRDLSLGVRALCALSRFHFESGRVVEALRWYDAALAQTIRPEALRAEALYLRAVLGRNQVSFAVALARFDEALVALRAHGAPETTAKALLYAANAARMTGDVAKAELYAAEARAAFVARGEGYLEGFAATAIGAAAYAAGDLARARTEFLVGIERFREFGARGDEALGLASAGRCSLGAGDLESAEAAFERALEIALSSGNQYAEAHARISLALLHLDRGRALAAQPHLSRAAVIALGAADVELSIIATEAIGEELLARGRLDRTAAALASADAARRDAAAHRAPTEQARYRNARAALSARALTLSDPDPAPSLASVLARYVHSPEGSLAEPR